MEAPPTYSRIPPVGLWLAMMWLVVSALLAVDARAQKTERYGAEQVIDGDELRRKGITRLAEALRYVQAARGATVDGFGHRFQLNGLSSFHEPGPAVYVDGHLVELGLLDTGSLHLIGIPVEAIDRIEIVAKPALIFGTFAGRGAIHIHTRPVVDGARVEAGITSTSEVGDPGPFAYVDDVPNVDTQGPDFRSVAEAGGERAGFRVAGAFQRHYLTQPPVLQRVVRLDPMHSPPRNEMISPVVTASWDGSSFGARIVGLAAAGRLYPYLPHASAEVATRYRAANVSALLQHNITRRTSLRHQISVVGLYAENPAGGSIPLQWDRRSLTLNSAIGRTLTRRVVVLGGTARFDRLPVDEVGRFTGALYAAIAGRMSETVEYQGGGMLTTDLDHSALKAYAGITVQPDRFHRGDFYVTIIEDLPHEQNIVDDWARRGAGIPEFPDQVSGPDDAIVVRATGDAEWTWTPNRRHAVAAGVGVRVAADTYIYDRSISLGDRRPLVTELTYRYAQGTLAIAWMEYASRMLPGRQRLFAHVQGVVSGDEPFHDVWRAVPSRKFGLSIYGPFAPDFELEASIVRQSGASWLEYASLDGAVPDLRSATMMDLSVYKRLLAGRLHLRLTLANLLRDTARYHPLGDDFDMSIRFDLLVEFGTPR